ncbi:winged helix-turn-helix transcriptional regulator [Cupriavidus basilensis]|uniref:Helix-turn-helix transcriptional regulator n=1 Tax=Cupriavidus basilensis TaxID=68895 RepID=A0A643G2P8_9BURK|nr:winged helix-turn-helix transcriptional regulator [Cupriavidus basilensis]QOT82135.1 helix-turn-helix transcriptional regulator [Cupriavidus basilensis]
MAPAEHRQIPNSSVVRALSIVGDGWVLRLLREAFRGVRRFSDFHERLGIPKAVLSKRLTHLVESGMFSLYEYQSVPLRHEYRLTEMGLDFWRVLLTMWDWEIRWDPDPGDMRLRLTHLDCGHESRPVSSCSHCTQPLQLADISRRPGPGQGSETMLPPRSRRRMNAGSAKSPGEPTLRSQIIRTVGDRWTPMVMGCIFRGNRRFNELEAELRIPPYILGQRLNELLELELIERRRYQEAPPRDEFLLTAKGLAQHHYTLQLMRWGDRWLAGDKGLPQLMIHNLCGHVFHADLRCSHCGEVLERERVRLL